MKKMSFLIYNVIEYFQCLVIEHQDNIAFDAWRRRRPLILKSIILTCTTEDPYSLGKICLSWL